MIESMRRQRPIFTEVARAARESDRVTVDYEGRIDGQPFEGSRRRTWPSSSARGRCCRKSTAP